VDDRDDTARSGASDTPVVRLIERVKKGPETSDGGFLQEVLRGHIEGRYWAELGCESRGVGFTPSADR
jgi:hypothetical protein